jgi:hypothetical protein
MYSYSCISKKRRDGPQRTFQTSHFQPPLTCPFHHLLQTLDSAVIYPHCIDVLEALSKCSNDKNSYIYQRLLQYYVTSCSTGLATVSDLVCHTFRPILPALASFVAMLETLLKKQEAILSSVVGEESIQEGRAAANETGTTTSQDDEFSVLLNVALNHAAKLSTVIVNGPQGFSMVYFPRV